MPAGSGFPFPVRNRLVYPAGHSPGFDPTHIASLGIAPGHGFSGICYVGGTGTTGVGWISLLTGKAGVASTPDGGTSTGFGPAIDGIIGPCVKGTATTTDYAWTFAQPNLISDASCTIGAMIRMANSNANNSTLFTNNTGGGTGTRIDIISLQPTFTYPGKAQLASSSFSLTLNAPYFVVGSVNSTTINYLACNLNTGQILTSTSANSSTPFAPTNATYGVGDGAGAGGATAIFGNFSHIMYSPKFMSMSELIYWAQDPWAFWYPDRPLSLVGANADTIMAQIWL